MSGAGEHPTGFDGAFPMAGSVEHERDRWRPPPGDEGEIEALAQAVLAGSPAPFAAIAAAAGAAHPAVAVDPAAGALPEAPLRFLLGYWTGLARAGGLPVARAVDPVEMRPALGHILLLDVLPSGYDFVYRLYGTGVARVAGQDWTGWTVGAMSAKTGMPYGPFYRSIYRASLIARVPVYTEHQSPSFLPAKSWRRLVLPLADENGNVVRFLVGNVPVEPRTLTSAEIGEALARLGPVPDPKKRPD